MVRVWIPPQLRSVTGGKSEVATSGQTVRDVLLDLTRQFPALGERVLDGAGQVRPYLNVYLNDEDIRFLQGDGTQVKDGDECSIIPEIGGGDAGH